LGDDNEKRYCAAHLAAGAVLAILGKSPKETLGLVFTVEIVERTTWAQRFPKLLRAGKGPFVIDILSTMAGYALVRSIK